MESKVQPDPPRKRGRGPKDKEGSRPLRATLRGFHQWAFEQVRIGQGGPEGEDSDALNHVIGRWLEQDRDCAARDFGITREAWREACGLKVADFQTEKAKRDKKTSAD